MKPNSARSPALFETLRQNHCAAPVRDAGACKRAEHGAGAVCSPQRGRSATLRRRSRLFQDRFQ